MMVVTKISDQTRQRGHKLQFLSKALSALRFSLCLPYHSLDSLGRCVCVCVCVFIKLHITTQSGPVILVCVCVFIKLHITTQSGPVILVILCHSH